MSSDGLMKFIFSSKNKMKFDGALDLKHGVQDAKIMTHSSLYWDLEYSTFLGLGSTWPEFLFGPK